MNPTQKWNQRQDMLVRVLRAHGAEKHDYRVDLRLGRFWWQAPGSQKPSVVAETRVLGSWALSNHTVLAGWANRSLPPSAVTEPVEGVSESDDCATEQEAWDWALAIAEGAGAHFVYRAPNAQSWIFLGLWNVRPAGPEDAPFEAGPPWEHVSRVLHELAGQRDEVERRQLMHNYGQTFVDDQARRGTQWEAALRQTGERLVELAAKAPDATALDRGIEELIAQLPEG